MLDAFLVLRLPGYPRLFLAFPNRQSKIEYRESGGASPRSCSVPTLLKRQFDAKCSILLDTDAVTPLGCPTMRRKMATLSDMAK
jgi:hypothetical protein